MRNHRQRDEVQSGSVTRGQPKPFLTPPTRAIQNIFEILALRLDRQNRFETPGQRVDELPKIISNPCPTCGYTKSI
jgi:hypothetical protein